MVVRDGTAGLLWGSACNYIAESECKEGACRLSPPELFLIAVSLCACRHSNEEYCFILLLTGLPRERCPSEAVCSKMELTSSNDSKSLLFLISKSFGCFKYLKDALEILGGQSSKILSFHQFL